MAASLNLGYVSFLEGCLIKSLKHRGNETGNDERVIFTKEERIFKFDDKAPENTEESAFGNNVTDVILVPDWLTIESFTAFRHCSH